MIMLFEFKCFANELHLNSINHVPLVIIVMFEVSSIFLRVSLSSYHRKELIFSLLLPIWLHRYIIPTFYQATIILRDKQVLADIARQIKNFIRSGLKNNFFGFLYLLASWPYFGGNFNEVDH